MKILVACELSEFALDELRALGKVQYEPAVSAERLPELLDGVGLLVVRRLRVSPRAIERGNALQMIIRAGAGTRNIAVEEASAEGVFVVHTPGFDFAAITELIFMLLLALDRGLIENAERVRDGVPAEDMADGQGLIGRRLGFIGPDAMLRPVIRRANAMEMATYAWTPVLTPERAAKLGIEFCAWPREVARKADVVAVYSSPNVDPDVLIDSDFVQNLPERASVVHVGHPGAIDEEALAASVRDKGLSVALDLYSFEDEEMPRLRSRLMHLPGVIVTRLGGKTRQARDAVAREVVRVARQFLVAGEVINPVNLLERSPATWQLLLRLRDTVGVMAAVMEAIRADGINAEEISSRVFAGAKAAWCSIALDERPSIDALEAMRSLEGVLHLELRAVV